MGNYKGTKNKVQVLNPKSGEYVLVDTKQGAILHHRKKPYKNVPIKSKNGIEEGG